jgi:hypothetical protein
MTIEDFLDKDLEMPLFVEHAVDGVTASLVEGVASKLLECELRKLNSFYGLKSGEPKSMSKCSNSITPSKMSEDSSL